MEGYFTIYFSKKLIIIGNNLPAHCPDCVPEQIKVKKGFNNVQNFPLNTQDITVYWDKYMKLVSLLINNGEKIRVCEKCKQVVPAINSRLSGRYMAASDTRQTQYPVGTGMHP